MLLETPPRAAAHQDEPCCNASRHVKTLHQPPGHQWHDAELRHGPDEDIQRLRGQNSEIDRAQGHAHGQHDEAQHQSLHIAMHPAEKPRYHKRSSRSSNDKGGGITG